MFLTLIHVVVLPSIFIIILWLRSNGMKVLHYMERVPHLNVTHFFTFQHKGIVICNYNYYTACIMIIPSRMIYKCCFLNAHRSLLIQKKIYLNNTLTMYIFTLVQLISINKGNQSILNIFPNKSEKIYTTEKRA